MSMIEAVKSVFSQYVGFTGRARRSEYWWFCLFNVIVSIVLSMITKVTGFTWLSLLYSFATLLPGIAVCIRRLHDIGKRGTYLLFVLIPIVGSILLIVWYCQDSQPGDNQFGPNPKGIN